MSQKGLTPILIVLLIAAALSGYFVYKMTVVQPVNITPSPSATQPSPSPQASSILTLKPTVKQVLTPKNTPTATPTPSPSPSLSPSPTSKPSPILGVYRIEQMPGAENTSFIGSQGYGISALLKDSNGDYIQDLSNFTFSWSIENPAIADLNVSSWGSIERTDCFSYEPYNIKTPCPALRADLVPKSSGSTTVKVKVTTKPNNKEVAAATYTFTVK